MIGMKLQDVELVVANQFIMVVPIPISHSQAQIRYKPQKKFLADMK